MSVEQKINYQLNKYPFIKKYIKRCYQLAMYAISPKIKSEGDISCVSPNDGKEYFFGYYDKSPWDASGRYVICMCAENTWSEPDPIESADILLIDTKEDNQFRKITTSHSWNVQQGCMAMWLGPDFSSKILYNDVRDGQYCSVVLDLTSSHERILPMPCYTVSNDGKTALCLDMARLHNLRPGYGYAAIEENTKDIALPDSSAVWVMNIETGEVKSLLTYKDFASFQPRSEMLESGTVHKVNHLMLSPNGKRFMVLYRWFNGQRKYTRLITCNVDGSDMYLLSDDDMVSHCFWKNDEEVLAFENKRNGGTGYYLMRDRTQEYTRLWPHISNDGHPSYSPVDDEIVVFDSYPDKRRVQEIKIASDTDVEGKSIKTIAKVFSPFKYDNDTRCDLHPRWSRDGKKVCFDGTFEGHRGLYVVNIKE